MDPPAFGALPWSHHQGQQSAFSEAPLPVAARVTCPQGLDRGGGLETSRPPGKRPARALTLWEEPSRSHREEALRSKGLVVVRGPPLCSCFLLRPALLGLWSSGGASEGTFRKQAARLRQVPGELHPPRSPEPQLCRRERCSRRRGPVAPTSDVGPPVTACSLCFAAGLSSSPLRSSFSSSSTPWGGRWLRTPPPAPASPAVTSRASSSPASGRPPPACGKGGSSFCAVAWGETTTLELLFPVRQSCYPPASQ